MIDTNLDSYLIGKSSFAIPTNIALSLINNLSIVLAISIIVCNLEKLLLKKKGWLRMEYKELNNGIKMPSLGIGTFMLEPDVAEEAVCNALKNGYRLIDTANAYVNEEDEKKLGRLENKKIWINTFPFIDWKFEFVK